MTAAQLKTAIAAGCRTAAQLARFWARIRRNKGIR